MGNVNKLKMSYGHHHFFLKHSTFQLNFDVLAILPALRHWFWYRNFNPISKKTREFFDCHMIAEIERRGTVENVRINYLLFFNRLDSFNLLMAIY